MDSYIIIGNGVAGITCALGLRKRQPEVSITVISKEGPFFFSRPALMYLFMGHMGSKELHPYENSFWKKQNIELVQDEILELDPLKKLIKGKQSDYPYAKLILALGSRPRLPEWVKDQNQKPIKGIQGLYHLQDIELLEQNLKSIKFLENPQPIVVGGGLIGVELAEMLHSRGLHPKLLIREKRFWNSVLPDPDADLVTRHIESRGIEIISNEEIKSLESDTEGKITAIETLKGTKIDCNFLGVTVGVVPNIHSIKISTGAESLKIDRGILVDENFAASLADIYAIGDCAQLIKPPGGRRPIEAVWYTAKFQGETLAAKLSGEDLKYQPGIWFNSAKFFDLEYQTYGVFPAKASDDEERFCWQAKDRELLIHLRWDKQSGRILAFNFLGTRARHALCEKWIAEGHSIKEVVKNIALVNFDPEFFKSWHLPFVNSFNDQFPIYKIDLEELATQKGRFSNLASKLVDRWLAKPKKTTESKEGVHS